MDISNEKQGLKVVAGFFICYCVVMGLVFNCYSVYIVPITEDLGFSRGDFAVSQSLMYAGNMVASLIGWRLYGKFGTVNVIRIALITMSVLYFSLSFASRLIVFYVVYFILGMTVGLTTTIPSALMIKQWIKTNANTKIGFAAMGSGVGGTLANFVTGKITSSLGWRFGYRYMSFFAVALLALPAFFLIKENPEALKEAEEEQRANAGERKKASKFAINKHIALYVACTFAINISTSIVLYNVTPHLQDIGYSATYAAGITSAAMAVLAGGKFLMGILVDKLGIKKVYILATASLGISLLALSFYRGFIFLIPYMAGILFGNPYGTVGTPAAAEYFAGKEFNVASVLSTMVTLGSIGGMISSTLVGYVYDFAGSYVPAFLVFAGINAVVLLLVPKIYYKG